MKPRQPRAPAHTSAPTFWINHASRMVLRRFDDRLRPLGFSMAYIRVAVALEEHGALQQKDLLGHVAIEQPTMTALLTRMERDRFLVRKLDPSDARARLVSLTSRGATVLTRAREVMLDVVEEAMVGVSKEDQERLISTLQIVVRNLTDDSVERSDDANLLVGARASRLVGATGAQTPHASVSSAARPKPARPVRNRRAAVQRG